MEGRGARVMGARRALVAVLIVALVATAAGADSGGGDGSRGTRSRVSSRNVGAGHQARRFGGGARVSARPDDDDDDDDDDADVGLYRGERRPVPIVLPDPADPTKLTLRSEAWTSCAPCGPSRPSSSSAPTAAASPSSSTNFSACPAAKVSASDTREDGDEGRVGVERARTRRRRPERPGVVYVDTEGFEATGMSDAYDDRIFALSSIMASVLVYNLPETVKEGDIEKLSFALELAREFSSRARTRPRSAARTPPPPPRRRRDTGNWDASQLAAFLPGSLLWLIQRDFLEGSTVNEMVRGALREVSNRAAIDTWTSSTASARRFARWRATSPHSDSQPHFERTKLCDMGDDELEPRYVRQRAELKALVRREARAKSSLGAALAPPPGRTRAAAVPRGALVERSVRRSTRVFPSAGNVVDSFNRDAMERHVASYVTSLDAVRLPAEEEALTTAHRDAASRATEGFRRDRFGRGAVTVKSLRARLEEIRDARLEKNAFVSGHECEALATSCEEALVGLQTMTSVASQFDDSARRARTIRATIVGPSTRPTPRVARSLERERAAFTQSYNARLLNGMLLFSVGVSSLFDSCGCSRSPSSRRGPRSSSSSWVPSSTSPLGSPCSTRRGGKRRRGSGSWRCITRSWTWIGWDPARGGVCRRRRVDRVRRFVSWVHSCCPCLVPGVVTPCWV